jgi:ectoine hydroxylase-related dioxygenase (phytanoyl-CoA dioxygenase family)
MSARQAVPARDCLNADLQHVESVLSRFANPWHRYFLTMSLDATAEVLTNCRAAHRAPAAKNPQNRKRRHPARLRNISAHEINQFRTLGYVKLKGILSEDQVVALRGALTAAMDSLPSSPNGYNVTTAADALWGAAAARDHEASTQHDLAALARAISQSDLPRLVDEQLPGQARGHFLLDTSAWRRVPALAAFALGSELPRITATLLDIPVVRFFDDQIFIKEAGAVDRVAFHQDLTYFHLDGTAGCVFWIPLDPVRSGSGRMGYVPGSHLWKKLFKPNIFASELPFPGSEGLDMPNIDADPGTFGVQYVEAEPGDVLVHHLLTIHGSEGNRGIATRRALSLRYCDATIRYRHRRGAPAQPLHRANMADGDPLDDAIHPLVWPAAKEAKAAQQR